MKTLKWCVWALLYYLCSYIITFKFYNIFLLTNYFHHIHETKPLSSDQIRIFELFLSVIICKWNRPLRSYAVLFRRGLSLHE